MRTEQRTVFIAKDDSEHRTEIDAQAHEAKLDLTEWCDNHLYRNISTSDICDTMIEKAESLAPLIEAVYKAKIAQKRLANSGRA